MYFWGSILKQYGCVGQKFGHACKVSRKHTRNSVDERVPEYTDLVQKAVATVKASDGYCNRQSLKYKSIHEMMHKNQYTEKSVVALRFV